ncbi:MAG: F0F1 ATP synthase subunit alpha, partial [Gammaproteobacteria bacterium]
EMGVSLYAATERFLEDVPVEKVLDFESALLAYMNSEEAEFMQRINETGEHNDEIVAHMRAAIEKFKATGAY